MHRYQIWDKTSPVITPSGEVFSAEQWAERYPMALMPNVKMVISGGAINGAVAMELSTMVDMYMHQGADFDGCETDRDILDVIEAWEDMSNMPVEDEDEEDDYDPMEVIASSLEYMAMNNIPIE